jgi:hypothetical protein
VLTFCFTRSSRRRSSYWWTRAPHTPSSLPQSITVYTHHAAEQKENLLPPRSFALRLFCASPLLLARLSSSSSSMVLAFQ